MSSAPAFSTALTDSQIQLTAAAKVKMGELLTEAEEDIDAVRIFVSGGGCGGMTYGMTFSESAAGTDCVLQAGEVRVVVDAVALSYLEGCEIDYKKQGANESFVFNNVFQSVGGSGVCGGCGGGGGSSGCGS